MCSYSYCKMPPFIQISNHRKEKGFGQTDISAQTLKKKKCQRGWDLAVIFGAHISIWQPSKIKISLQDGINVCSGDLLIHSHKVVKTFNFCRQ